LAPIDTLETQLGYLRSRGHEVVVLRILDPAEIEFRFAESAVFRDIESGRELYVDPPSARRQYLERFAGHALAIERACRGLGIEFHPLTTDRPLELALFDFLSSRLRRGRSAGRRQVPMAGRGRNG
jgi:uncharacterized protein (DUF58 family)